MRYKLTVLLLALTLICGLLSGCGGAASEVRTSVPAETASAEPDTAPEPVEEPEEEEQELPALEAEASLEAGPPLCPLTEEIL